MARHSESSLMAQSKFARSHLLMTHLSFDGKIITPGLVNSAEKLPDTSVRWATSRADCAFVYIIELSSHTTYLFVSIKRKTEHFAQPLPTSRFWVPLVTFDAPIHETRQA